METYFSVLLWSEPGLWPRALTGTNPNNISSPSSKVVLTMNASDKCLDIGREENPVGHTRYPTTCVPVSPTCTVVSRMACSMRLMTVSCSVLMIASTGDQARHESGCGKVCVWLAVLRVLGLLWHRAVPGREEY